MIYNERYRTKSATDFGGGMGTVKVCFDPHLERDVAIKFLYAATERRRIFDEIKALMTVRSPHVVQVYDIVVKDQQIGIVQEFLPGSDLAEFEPASPDAMLRILYQLARGLRDIHASGVIHRDIKPTNLKFDSEGLLKIFDFGLSRIDNDAATRGFRGSRGYAAPELYTSGHVSFDTSVDVYAFGVTAVVLASGGLPNEFVSIPPDIPAWVTEIGDLATYLSIPERVAELLERCLSADRLLRPSMDEATRVLEAQLLCGRHRARLTHGSRVFVCGDHNRRAALRVKDIGSISITYDGYDFIVGSAPENAYINNALVHANAPIRGSCVISLGAPSLGNGRTHVTFDVSKPEVIL